MDTQWILPEMVELTLEELVESTDLDIACATQTDQGSNQDHM